MGERRLETVRFLVLARQLEANLGSRNAAAHALTVEPSYLSHLRGHPERNIGGEVRARVAEKLGISPRFFDDPTAGDEPDYRDYLSDDAPAVARTVQDEGVRTALTELLADWDEELHGAPPNEEEVDWLNTKIDFRQDRRAGLEITPRLLLDRLRERRRQQRGKSVERPRLKPPAPRPGTRKLPETKKRRGG